jgi:hypothetical protein
MNEILRKQHTGQAGNPGEFGNHNRTEATTTLSSDTLTIIKLEFPDPKGGYDEIHSSPDGMRAYFRDGLLHNEDGAALDVGIIFDPSGLGQTAWLNGKMLTSPEEGLYFDGMQPGNGGMQQIWTTGGNTIVSVDEDGQTIFTHDGDIDRAGAPAITGGGKPDVWVRHGNIINNPIPAAPTVSQLPENNRQYVGSQFVDGMTPATASAHIRERLLEAQYAGVLGTGMLEKTKATVHGTPGNPDKPQVLRIQFAPYRRADFGTTAHDHGAKFINNAEGDRVTALMAAIGNSYNRWSEDTLLKPRAQTFVVETEII